MTAKHPMIPFPVIVRAADGDIEAVNQIVRHYSGFIASRSMRPIPTMEKPRLKRPKAVQPLKSTSSPQEAIPLPKKMREILSSATKTASDRQRICLTAYIPFIRPPAGKAVS